MDQNLGHYDSSESKVQTEETKMEESQATATQVVKSSGKVIPPAATSFVISIDSVVLINGKTSSSISVTENYPDPCYGVSTCFLLLDKISWLRGCGASGRWLNLKLSFHWKAVKVCALLQAEQINRLVSQSKIQIQIHIETTNTDKNKNKYKYTQAQQINRARGIPAICHNHRNRWLCKKFQSSVKFSSGKGVIFHIGYNFLHGV